MAKRKPLSKSVRFEVFKRDSFRCMYCGQSPPAVILHVDHILPISQGGGDDLANLLTSCQDCNLGKSDRDLGQVPASLAETIERRREMAEQVEAYNLFLLEERSRELEAVRRLGMYFCDRYKPKKDRGQYMVGDRKQQSLRRFLRQIPEIEILDGIDLAFARVRPRECEAEDTWRYFCGICWRKIKGDKKEG